jgi:hypothetical protein
VTINAGGSNNPNGRPNGNSFNVQATGIATFLNTGPGNDMVNVGGNGNSTGGPSAVSLDPIQGTLTVDGQGGTNTLTLNDQGAAGPEQYTVTSRMVSRSNSAGVIYSNIQNLVLEGGNHGNTFDVGSTPAGTNVTVDTGTGVNKVNVGGPGQNLDGIMGPLTIADQGTDRVYLNDHLSLGGHTYTLTTSTLSRSAAGLISFDLTKATVYVIGGGGRNTLSAAGVLTHWTINATNAGWWGSKVHFTAMQNLVATTIANTFKFVNAGNITGYLTGDGGTLDYSANGGLPITVNLQMQTASAIGGTVSAISGLIGSTATTNTLYAANAFNNWAINQPNGGTLNGLTGFVFSGIENLVGGTGVDIFKIFPTGTVSSIDGQGAPSGQGDWLDYSPFATAVQVNLVTGSATNVGGGAPGSVKNIQDVMGGSGSNTLTGDAQGNLLIGGHGTITGGTGRSLLIGHSGSNTITGGSGGSASGGDILIPGATVYDTDTNPHLLALMSILAEWQSADSYDTRFNDINQGTAYPGGSHLNGTNTLSLGSTVFSDIVPNTLNGATSQQGLTPPVDWFFASPLDNLFGYETGEHMNNT